MQPFKIRILGCGSALPTLKHFASSQIIEVRDKTFMVDCGEGTQIQVRRARIHFNKILAIFITHLHGDHIGGLINDGKAVFPNADIYVSKPEYDGWMSMEADKKAQVVAVSDAYNGRMHLFSFGETLPGGVKAMDAVGHTPGHTVYQVGKLLVVGDLMHGASLQMVNPDICASYDMDADGAVKTRRYYLEYARDNDLVMAGMHFPEPAFLEF